LQIGIGNSEAAAELFGREPSMEFRRRCVVQIFEETIELLLLLRGAFEHEHDSFHGKAGGSGAAIVAILRQWMGVAVQHDTVLGSDRCDANGGGSEEVEDLRRSHQFTFRQT
jgi:hypothetical protein